MLHYILYYLSSATHVHAQARFTHSERPAGIRVLSLPLGVCGRRHPACGGLCDVRLPADAQGHAQQEPRQAKAIATGAVVDIKGDSIDSV